MNNKGFSMVEVIIVLAIIAVLTVSAGIGVTTLTGFYAKEFSENFESEYNRARAMSLSYVNTSLTISADSSGIYSELKNESADGTIETTSTRIGKNSVVLKDASGNLITKLVFTFNRESGSLINYTVDEFTVTQGNKTYRIKLFPETGKLITN